MLENDAQLAQALELLSGFYRALADLRQRVKPQSAPWFAVMAEGPIEEIARLKAEIEAYAGEAAGKERLAAASAPHP